MSSVNGKRPANYQYFAILNVHLGGDLTRIFNGELVYPRQLEIHLSSDHKRACNYDCFYCAGRKFQKDLSPFEAEALKLLERLDGKIPYIIYGGSFTEPILNPYLLTFLLMTKRTGCHFGIHTNGSLLKRLEEDQGWLTELSRIAEDRIDYLSISLDAGSMESHCKTKGIKHDWYSEIIEGIRMAAKLRDKARGPAVRVCYLMNKLNSSVGEIRNIVETCREIGTDSLRFSIPFAHYRQEFDAVRKYKRKVEVKYNQTYYQRVSPYLSTNQDDKPYIFWMSPEFQDIDLFDFPQCAYGYYQICLAADGYVYRCTTISTPSFKKLRLGKITDDLEEFKQMIRRNQDPTFDTSQCFRCGARCNRMGLEINRGWRDANKV